MSDSPVSIADLRRLAVVGGTTQADPRAPDAWRREGLRRAQLHEVYAAEEEDAAAATGFAAALALAAGALPLMWVRVERDERAAGWRSR